MLSRAWPPWQGLQAPLPLLLQPGLCWELSEGRALLQSSKSQVSPLPKAAGQHLRDSSSHQLRCSQVSEVEVRCTQGRPHTGLRPCSSCVVALGGPLA